MKCKKCNNEFFKVVIRTNCGDCPENGAYDEDEEEYIFDEKIIEEKDLTRIYVDDNGECNFGTTHGMGCWMIICSKCGAKTNMPTVNF